jgi:hypothetical protein
MHMKFDRKFRSMIRRRNHWWEDPVKMDLEEIECERVDWMELAHNVVQR